MALPKVGDGYQVTDGNLNEAVNVGRAGQTVNLGGSGAALGFYGKTAITQPASADQAALTLTTATSNGFGFSTATAFSAATAQLEAIRVALVNVGILKGSA